MDACLHILKDGRLTRAFGDAYLNLLYKHVLSCDHYLGHITPANWDGNLFIFLFKTLFLFYTFYQLLQKHFFL